MDNVVNSEMLYMAYDGDNAGRLVGRAILSNDPKSLHEVSQRINLGHEIVKRWVEGYGGEVISGGGDEGTFSIPRSAVEAIEELRKDYEFATNLTMSIGTGSNLSEAGKALLVAKFRGKNTVVHYDENIEKEVASAAEKVAQGKGSPEETKLAEAYLRPDVDEKTFNNESQAERAAEYRDQDLIPPMIDKPDPSQENKKQLGVPMEIPESDRHMNEVKPDPEQNAQKLPKPAPKDYLQGQSVPAEQVPPQPGEVQADSTDDTTYEEEATAGSRNNGDESVQGEPISIEAELDQNLENEQDMLNEMDSKSPDSKPVEEELDQHLENEQDMLNEMDNQQQNAPGDMGLSEDDASPDLSAVLKDGLDSHADNIQREKVVDMVSQALEGFKANKQILEKAKDQAPQLYESCLAMLRAMIEMARMLGLGESSQEDVDEIEQPSPEEAPAPEAVESAPPAADQGDAAPSPKQ
jgi:hypothetical protein